MFSGYKNTNIAARQVAYEPIHFHSSSKLRESRVAWPNGRGRKGLLLTWEVALTALSLPTQKTSSWLALRITAVTLAPGGARLGSLKRRVANWPLLIWKFANVACTAPSLPIQKTSSWLALRITAVTLAPGGTRLGSLKRRVAIWPLLVWRFAIVGWTAASLPT